MQSSAQMAASTSTNYLLRPPLRITAASRAISWFSASERSFSLPAFHIMNLFRLVTGILMNSE